MSDGEPGGALPWAALDAEAEQVRTPCGDGTMLWRVWGAGSVPLVLLHGGAGSWLHWLRTIPAFAGERRVVVPDLPGLGGSALPPSPQDGNGSADIVAQGLATVCPDQPVDLVGFSFGGVLAGLIASRHPAAIRSVTLVGSGGLGVILKTAKLERVRDKTGPDRDEAHRLNLSRWMIADPARIDPLAIQVQDWNSRHARLDSRPIGVSSLLVQALPEIQAPIAGIWGARDHAVEGDTERVRAALEALGPGLPFQVVPEAGHWIAYEAAEAFEAALRAVLPEGPAR